MNKNHSFKNSIYYLKYIFKFDCIRVPGIVINTFINSFDAWFIRVFIIKEIVDALLNSFEFERIVWLLFCAIGFKSLKLIYDPCWLYYTKHSDQKITAGFQQIVFSKASEVDLGCYDDSSFYNDYVYSVQDSSTRPLLFINSISQLLQTIFTVSLSGIYVISSDSVLLIFSIIPIIGDSITRLMMNKIREKRTSLIIPENKKIEYVKRTSYLRENSIDLRITNIHSVLLNIFQNGLDNIIKIYKKYSKKFIAMYFLSDCLTHINNTLVIVYLIYKIVFLKTLTAGDFVAIKEAISLVSKNLGKIVERVQAFQEHSIYIEKYKTFCEYENKVVFGASSLPEPQSSNYELELNQVSFSYNQRKQTLNQLNLSLKEGELIGIVGLNGAGKSTLVKLLLHMYEPTNGSIKFRGTNIKAFSKEKYLSQFDTVFQEYNTYAFDFLENVVFDANLPECEINEIKTIFKHLGFDEFLPLIEQDVTLTKEFSEDGLVLSGGQTQKIALVRAIYRKNAILILDEPSSALDAISEHKLMKCLREVAKDRTVIFISHRLSSIRDADCIYFMENGQVIECGTHDELMIQQGKYYEMFKIQADAYNN